MITVIAAIAITSAQRVNRHVVEISMNADFKGGMAQARVPEVAR